jgi:hypothetical protein
LKSPLIPKGGYETLYLEKMDELQKTIEKFLALNLFLF